MPLCKCCGEHWIYTQRCAGCGNTERVTDDIESLRAENAAMREQLRHGSLAELRSMGWSVAVHNDYKQLGFPMTFWLFTHPDGRWVKGEGRTDIEAIGQARTAAAGEDGSGG